MKSPYGSLPYDERNLVVETPDEPMDIDEWERDRTSGVNAEPTDGIRDGVTSARRMHPNRYIPNGRPCK